MDYVSDFNITTEEGDHYEAQVKDPEAVTIEEGEIVDTKVTFEGAESDSISSFTDFVDNFISGTKVGRWFKNFKAGCQFILHMGSLVNDCVSDNPDLPLAASQGKVLMDLFTQANSDISQVKSDLSELYLEFTSTSTIDDFCETIWSTKSGAKGFFSCNYTVMSFLTNGDYAETNSSNFYGMFSRNGSTNIEYFMASPASNKFYIGRVSADKKLTRLSTIVTTWVIT